MYKQIDLTLRKQASIPKQYILKVQGFQWIITILNWPLYKRQGLLFNENTEVHIPKCMGHFLKSHLRKWHNKKHAL